MKFNKEIVRENLKLNNIKKEFKFVDVILLLIILLLWAQASEYRSAYASCLEICNQNDYWLPSSDKLDFDIIKTNTTFNITIIERGNIKQNDKTS
jgi:hypothetical protein